MGAPAKSFFGHPVITDPVAGLRLGGSTVLVTGGAGFVGSAIARRLAAPTVGARVVTLDNLRRRGSEFTVPLLAAAGVEFVHGDVRSAEDLSLGGRPVDLIVECAAEPSVLAGYHGARYVVDANLGGLVNCLELARERKARIVFLSTSRVYPVARVNSLAVDETPTRFVLRDGQATPGASAAGIAEDFPMGGVRTLYGATKLAGELLLEEYAAAFGVESVVNRFGVIAGPGQMGKVDQGVFALWMSRYVFGGGLRYQGWGGRGQQVRDVLHIEDACDVIEAQLAAWDTVAGHTWNVGGGLANSVSLAETTALCEEVTGQRLPVTSSPDTHPSDVRLFITDHRAVSAALGWAPRRSPRRVLEDLHAWMRANEAMLAPVFRA